MNRWTGSSVRLAALAATALVFAGGLYLHAIAGAGFPDGHLTAYQRWMVPRAQLVVGGLGAIGVGCVVLAAVRSAPSWLVRLLGLGLLALAVTAVALPYIGLQVLQLEHGQGG